jgi:hypothetical protein
MPGLYYVLMACINNDDDHQLAGQLNKKQNSICGRDLAHLAAPFVAHACMEREVVAVVGTIHNQSSHTHTQYSKPVSIYYHHLIALLSRPQQAIQQRIPSRVLTL